MFYLRSMTTHTNFFLLFLSSSLALCGQAKRSFGEESKVQKQPSSIRGYAGVRGFVNGSFISEPSEKTISEYPGALIPYPGFGGVGGGGGGEVGVSWKALSLDLGFDYSVDQAEGRINGQAITLSQTTYHIPLTLRVSVPQAKLIRPSLFGGVNWVSTTGVELDAPSIGGLQTPDEESYTAWRFGLGFEVFIDDSLSIPFRLQAIYAPLNGDNLDDRVEIGALSGNTLSSFKYKSKWEWQPQVSLGLTYHFGPKVSPAP